jgi:hypothetical protein
VTAKELSDAWREVLNDFFPEGITGPDWGDPSGEPYIPPPKPKRRAVTRMVVEPLIAPRPEEHDEWVKEIADRAANARRELPPVPWRDLGLQFRLPPGLLARLVAEFHPELADPMFPPIEEMGR